MRTHGPLNIEFFLDPGFQENGYLLWTNSGPDAWIVDPGFPPQAERLLATLQSKSLTPQAILLTHAHVDHIAGIEELRSVWPELPIWAPASEEQMLPDPAENLSALMGLSVVAPPPTRLINPGDKLQLGPLTWTALDVRGHSPGGRAYYCPDAGVVFTGDALFAGSIGRTDFPGGDHEQLLANIRANLFTLPDDTVVYSGHGPATTIVRERDTNPFFREGVAWE